MPLVNTPLAPRSRGKSSIRRLALAAGAAFLAGLIVLSLGGREPSVPAPTPDLGQVRATSGDMFQGVFAWTIENTNTTAPLNTSFAPLEPVKNNHWR